MCRWVRYTRFMSMKTQSIKYIVTAFAVMVGFSLPVAADEARLDDLFTQLREAEPAQAKYIEDQIWAEWSKSGSAAMDLLLKRGEDAIDDGEFAVAVDHFSALIDHAPDFAEGYHGRATAFFLLGQYGQSLDDLRQALVLNPRHFGALRGFGLILEELGQEAQALDVMRQVAALHPNAEGVAEAIERLEVKLEGQTL